MKNKIKWLSNGLILAGFLFFSNVMASALMSSPISLDARAAATSLLSVACVAMIILCVVTSFDWRRVEA